MFGKLARDESGVVLGLAVVMIVLIGVMGAGLLVFVQQDLKAVVEVNQGQKALETAEAGVQAGRRELLKDATADATTNGYDGNDSNGNSPWSALSGGRNLTFDGNSMNVKIQYLLPSYTATELNDPNHAPELVPAGETDYPEPKDYFKITSEGTTGEAKRKLETIYLTADMGVPKGYYTPGTIKVAGSACIDSVSLFSLSNVEFLGGGTGCGSGQNIKGVDLAYGDWYRPPFNTTARAAAPTCTATNGTTGKCAGVGAAGKVSGSTGLGTRDYQGDTAAPTNPKFVQKTSPDGGQEADEISFPFDYALPDHAFLRDVAKENGTYYEVSGGTVSVNDWPAPPAGSPASSTVVYYRFTGNTSDTLKWDVNGSCSNPADNKEGTLVVENGNFTMQPNKARFVGAVVVRGGQDADETADGTSDDTVQTCLEGFVNAQGDIKIAANVSAMNTEKAAKRPGWYDVKLWSWRECYTPTCT